MLAPAHHFFDFTPESLAAWCAQRRMPAFRARQVLEWVYDRGVIDPGQMSNLSKLDRETLAREMTFLSGRTIADRRASDGVCKLLIDWGLPAETSNVSAAATAPTAVDHPLPVLSGSSLGTDHSSLSTSTGTSSQTECVMIPTEDRRTACISSQVGCPVGCRFCASGIGGLDANLSAGRIVEQVWRLAAVPGPERRRITNVVFMGMGEPLSNFDNVTRAIRTICALSPAGLGISARKVTISTVGLPKYIDRLAAEFDLPVTLALSLHAPTDDIRRSLIPWAEYTTIDDLLDACQRWFAKTGREITLEYTLLRGVNDKAEHAELLAKLARSLRANVNLIRYNEVEGMPFERPRDADVLKFQAVLKGRQVNTHIRASRGRDIAAACGQLRHEHARA